jgi:hypothetical protein
MPHQYETPHVSHLQGGTLMKRHNVIGCFVCVLSMTAMLHAQAVPTASRVGSISAGVGGTLIGPDFGQTKIGAITFWGDINLPFSLGVEGVIHYSVHTPSDVSENSYLIGPRYIIRHKRLEGYGKVLLGVGHFGLQVGSNPYPGTSTYFEYAAGVGLDVHATNHINIRAIDFEAQKWPGFEANGLSPYALTFGASYVFH